MLNTSTTRRIRLVASLAILTALTFALAVLSWQGGQEARAVEGETPAYQVLSVSDAPGVREAVVSTEETREAGLRLIAEDLRAENTPEGGTLLVEYRKDRNPERSTGFALVFDSKEAVLAPGRYADYDEADAEQIMEREGGIRVVGFEEFSEENPTVWERVKRFLR